MKHIYYDKNEYFILTEQEFEKAIEAWQNKQSFYCSRLQALLSPYCRFVKTPAEEILYKVFFLKTKDGFIKIFKQNNKYFRKEKTGLGHKMYLFPLSPQLKTKLISQENFYNNQLYGGKKETKALPQKEET